MASQNAGIRGTDKRGFVILAAAAALLGLAMIIWAETVTQILCYILGGLLLLYGAADVVRYFLGKEDSAFRSGLVDGALAFGIGMFLVLRPGAVSAAFGIICGIMMLVNSLFKLQFGLNLLRANDRRAATVLALAGAGLILAAVTFCVPDLLIRILGIFLLADGIGDLAALFCIGRYEKCAERIRGSVSAEQ